MERRIEMKTLDLKQAADFLKMSPEGLRQKTKAGDIPGAKVGKQWVFLEEDLVEYIRASYPVQRQALRVPNPTEDKSWHYANAATSGGLTSRRQMAREYASRLGLATR